MGGRAQVSGRFNLDANSSALLFALSGQSNAGGANMNAAGWAPVAGTYPTPVPNAMGVSFNGNILIPLNVSYKSAVSSPFGPFVTMMQQLGPITHRTQNFLQLYYADGTSITVWAPTVVNTTGTYLITSPTVTVADPTGLVVGMQAVATGIPANTVINTIVGNVVTLSANTTSGQTNIAIAFSWANYQAIKNRINNTMTNFLASVGKPLGYNTLQMAGIYWLQGESDATDINLANAYQANLTALVAGLRSDCGLPNMPFVISRLSNSQTSLPYLTTVQAAQDAVAAAVPNVICVNQDGLPVQVDNLHFTAAGYVQATQNLNNAWQAAFGSKFI